MGDIEIFAEELERAIWNDPLIKRADRLVFAIRTATRETVSRRAQSEDASRKKGE